MRGEGIGDSLLAGSQVKSFVLHCFSIVPVSNLSSIIYKQVPSPLKPNPLANIVVSVDSLPGPPDPALAIVFYPA